MRYCCITLAVALITLPAAAIDRFHQVDARLYRGAQPAPAEFKDLAGKGIKTVLDLRDGDRSEEQKLVKAAGMRYINVPMKGFALPTDEQISKALSTIDDKASVPVFVHCRLGKDRTGTVVACYRIARERWENERALREARTLGMSWLQRAMQSYVRQFQPAPVAVD